MVYKPAFNTKDHVNQARHYDHGKEMGEIGNSLGHPLKLNIANFIYEQGQEDRSWKCPHRLVKGDHDGVFHHVPKEKGMEKENEMLEVYKGSRQLLENIHVGLHVLEGNDQPNHGNVFEDYEI